MGSKPSPSSALSNFVKENIVPAVGAIILALIIRGFAVQPFTIPTGSMEPTLHGDYARGDKILADKAAYSFTAPERLDVAVFKYPEDFGKKRDFIKRVVGLPGEKFQIHRGDVYINDNILRKPLEKQKGIWIPVHTADLTKEPLLQPWRPVNAKSTPQGLLLDGHTDAAQLVYPSDIADSLQNSRGMYNVGDIMLRLKLALVSGDGGRLQIQLREPAGESAAVLSFNADAVKCSLFRTASQRTELASVETPAWEPYRPHTLEFSSYDRTVNLLLDGRPVASQAYEPESVLLSRSVPVRLSVQGASVVVETLGLYRDIYWTNAEPFARPGSPLFIPEGKYVVLGDNSPKSEDSRRWRTSPYVPRGNLVGRASVVFWPPWRWRLIR